MAVLTPDIDLVTSSPNIEIRGLRVAFGKKIVLDHIDLDVAPGQHLVLMGISGSGKSVLLKCILGLLTPLAGSVKIRGSVVSGATEAERDVFMRMIGVLFQNGALFDSLPIWRNIAFRLTEVDRMSNEKARSLIVGALWGLWHVPLFFIPGTGQSQMPMALFLASSFALSIVFARLSINTAFSVLPALLLHWSINAWSLVIPMVPNGGSVRPYVLVMGILFAFAAVAFLLPGPKRRPA
jgi:ABC-type dipeptide/oligopeptide/nickel transport system ATPase component